jgi:hypothetical protein
LVAGFVLLQKTVDRGLIGFTRSFGSPIRIWLRRITLLEQVTFQEQ